HFLSSPLASAFPCCTWSSALRTCRRQCPGRSDGTCSLVPFHQLRPSHEPGRVGSCIVGFGACSAFTHVTAYTLAKSPSDSLHQRLQQSRCLHYCSDCYRVERTSSRTGLTPAVDHHLSRRTRSADITVDNSNGRYISRDNGEEYKCKIEGQKMLERGKNDVPSTAPAPAAP